MFKKLFRRSAIPAQLQPKPAPEQAEATAAPKFPPPELKDGSDEPQVIQGPVVYRGNVVFQTGRGGSRIYVDGELAHDSRLHKPQVIHGGVVHEGGVRFEVG